MEDDKAGRPFGLRLSEGLGPNATDDEIKAAAEAAELACVLTRRCGAAFLAKT